MQPLSCKDVCSATLASKAFWHFGSALSSNEAYGINLSQHLHSLRRFQASRAPLGLTVCCCTQLPVSKLLHHPGVSPWFTAAIHHAV